MAIKHIGVLIMSFGLPAFPPAPSQQWSRKIRNCIQSHGKPCQSRSAKQFWKKLTVLWSFCFPSWSRLSVGRVSTIAQKVLQHYSWVFPFLLNKIKMSEADLGWNPELCYFLPLVPFQTRLFYTLYDLPGVSMFVEHMCFLHCCTVVI